MVFVNSMSDLFQDKVPVTFIQHVFTTMRAAHWHRFQVLTKRSRRLLELSEQLDWEANIWMGVSVESEKYEFRIDDLRKTGAAIKFLSLEPLLGPLPKLNLSGIDWVIVGGESGPGARPMHKQWVISIRDQCSAAEVPFFSSSGGAQIRRRRDESLTAGSTMRCRAAASRPTIRQLYLRSSLPKSEYLTSDGWSGVGRGASGATGTPLLRPDLKAGQGITWSRITRIARRKQKDREHLYLARRPGHRHRRSIDDRALAGKRSQAGTARLDDGRDE